MKKILVADVPQMDERYAAAFAGWELTVVRTVADALGALAAARADLVVIGVYFDDSRMFDLVRAIRADESARELPILCVRGRSGFTAVSTRTLEMTVKALGGDEFLDLVNFGDAAAGNRALGEAAGRLVKG